MRSWVLLDLCRRALSWSNTITFLSILRLLILKSWSSVLFHFLVNFLHKIFSYGWRSPISFIIMNIRAAISINCYPFLYHRIAHNVFSINFTWQWISAAFTCSQSLDVFQILTYKTYFRNGICGFVTDVRKRRAYAKYPLQGCSGRISIRYLPKKHASYMIYRKVQIVFSGFISIISIKNLIQVCFSGNCIIYSFRVYCADYFDLTTMTSK